MEEKVLFFQTLRKGHVKTQQGGVHLQARKRALPRPDHTGPLISRTTRDGLLLFKTVMLGKIEGRGRRDDRG